MCSTIYADDIQLYVVADPNRPGDVACALFKLAECVKDIQQWMSMNKLKLNQDKTEFFVASSPHHHTKVHHLSLIIGDTEIHQSDSIRNLGVYFDHHMTMNQRSKIRLSVSPGQPKKSPDNQKYWCGCPTDNH